MESGTSAPASAADEPASDDGSLARRLERLTAGRLEAMLDDAQRHPLGLPSPDRLRELATLAALLSVSDRMAPVAPVSPSRWPAAAALALVTIAVGALLFLHVAQTEIELDATASEVAFTLARAQALTEPTVLRFVGVAGFDTVAGLDGDLPAHRRLALAATATDAACAGSITLDRLILPRGAQVRLGRSPLPQRAHLVIHAPGATLQLTLDGCVRTGSATGAPSITRAVRTLGIALGRDDVDFDLQGAGDAMFALAPSVHTEELSLSRVEEIAGDGITLVRHVSTVTGGTLLFDALDGQSRTLRVAEPIRFERVDGELRSVALDGKQIALRFHGDVRGMVSGSDSHPRSWMPTWLEWLKANHAASLFWAAATSGFALLTALLKWWKPASAKSAP